MGAWFEAKIVKITKKSSAAQVPLSTEQKDVLSLEEAIVPGDKDLVVSESTTSEGKAKSNEDDGYIYSIVFERYNYNTSWVFIGAILYT